MKFKNRQLVKKLIKFEIGYHLLIWIVIRPILNKVFQIYLNTNSGIAFNENMLFNLLSIPGILVTLFIFILMTITIYYELSVVITMINRTKNNQPILLGQLLLEKISDLDVLKHPSTFLLAFVLVFLFPLVHVGYVNSLIFRLRIPNFITSELKLTLMGQIGLVLLYGLIAVLFLSVCLTPIIMVIQKENFIKAIKTQKQLILQASHKVKGIILVIMSLWFFCECLFKHFIPQAVLRNSDFNRFFFKYLVRYPSFRAELLRYLSVTILSIMLMCLFIYIILKYVPINNNQVYKAYNFKFFNQLKSRMISEYEKLRGIALYQKHSKLVKNSIKVVSVLFVYLSTHDLLLTILLTVVLFWYAYFPRLGDILICLLFVYVISIQTTDFISTFFTILLIGLMVYIGVCIFEPTVISKKQFTYLFDKTISIIKNWRFYKRYPKLVIGFFIFLALDVVIIYFNEVPSVHQPYVIGHRGSFYQVENSVEAILYASNHKADMIEIDVILSSDNVPMVIHDQSLQRLANQNLNVSDLTYEQLKTIMITQDQITTSIPSLKEVIDALKQYESESILLIEFKMSGQRGMDLTSQVIEVVEESGYQNKCAFMSLDYQITQYLQDKKPEWWIGYCVYGSVGKMNRFNLWKMNIDFLAVEESNVTNNLIHQAKLASVPIYVWTVDRIETMKQYLNMGVDGIITNYPQEARKIVDEYIEDHPRQTLIPFRQYPQ